ncbi:hypothetical protein KEM56_000771 [Ascosphaera pollenicola]|nr:hypothetical protein KEM56_000771 [Ascosphaera pollenicola]
MEEPTPAASSNQAPEKPPGKRELTPMERAGIMGAYKCGVPIRQIALKLGWSRTTVHDTIKKAGLRDNHASLARSGRPSKLTDRQKRDIIREVRQNPTKTKKAILEGLAFPIGKRAFNNVLKEVGLEGMTGQKIFYPKEPEVNATDGDMHAELEQKEGSTGTTQNEAEGTATATTS